MGHSQFWHHHQNCHRPGACPVRASWTGPSAQGGERSVEHSGQSSHSYPDGWTSEGIWIAESSNLGIRAVSIVTWRLAYSSGASHVWPISSGEGMVGPDGARRWDPIWSLARGITATASTPTSSRRWSAAETAESGNEGSYYATSSATRSSEAGHCLRENLELNCHPLQVVYTVSTRWGIREGGPVEANLGAEDSSFSVRSPCSFEAVEEVVVQGWRTEVDSARCIDLGQCVGEICWCLKVGGNHMSFRVSAARQELGVDHRPTMGTLKDLAEYLQAESEELSLMMGMKAATSAQSNYPGQSNWSQPSGEGYDLWESRSRSGDQGETKPHKAPCKFWKSDEGCRKGVECTYLHDATDMKGQCFGCGSTSHVKKECPVKRPGDQNPNTEKVKKIQKPKIACEKADKKGDKPVPAPSTTTTTDAKEDGKAKVSAEPVQGRGDQPEVTQGTPISATEELLKEALLLKSLKSQSLKAIRLKSVGEGIYGAPGEFALLDGGATNALRKARPEEMQKLVPTTVELAHGTTTLYRVPSDTLVNFWGRADYSVGMVGSRRLSHRLEQGSLCDSTPRERTPDMWIAGGVSSYGQSFGIESVGRLGKGACRNEGCSAWKGGSVVDSSFSWPTTSATSMDWRAMEVGGHVAVEPAQKKKVAEIKRVKIIDLGKLGNRRDTRCCALTSRREVTCAILRCGLSFGSLLQVTGWLESLEDRRAVQFQGWGWDVQAQFHYEEEPLKRDGGWQA